jgi:hypothetical protein
MKCCICKGEIETHGTYTEGHNAEPSVKDGRCCDNCNMLVVIPERLKLITQYQQSCIDNKQKGTSWDSDIEPHA